MNGEPYEKLRRRVSSDLERYKALRGHFEKFCAHAEWLGGPNSEVKGIKVSKDNGALLIEFIDRRIRVSMRFDRKAGKGVLHVEDESAAGPLRSAETLERIPFDFSSGTELDGGALGGKLFLGQPADCITLALHIIDTALDQDPWKEHHNVGV